MRGKPDDALARSLHPVISNRRQHYISRTSYQAAGQMLKAAAQFQTVIERYPLSGLRDHAMLAKANIFLDSGAYKTAAEEFEMVIARANDANVVAQAELRRAACVFLDNDFETGTQLLRDVTVNARAPRWPHAPSFFSAKS